MINKNIVIGVVAVVILIGAAYWFLERTTVGFDCDDTGVLSSVTVDYDPDIWGDIHVVLDGEDFYYDSNGHDMSEITPFIGKRVTINSYECIFFNSIRLSYWYE